MILGLVSIVAAIWALFAGISWWHVLMGFVCFNMIGAFVMDFDGRTRHMERGHVIKTRIFFATIILLTGWAAIP
jgi:hypothetical protein